MELEITQPQTVNAKVLKICCKVSDSFNATLLSDKDQILTQYEGYVPDFMPEEHHGDYVELNIDIDTGQILNWTKPTTEQMELFICGDNDNG